MKKTKDENKSVFLKILFSLIGVFSGILVGVLDFLNLFLMGQQLTRCFLVQ